MSNPAAAQTAGASADPAIDRAQRRLARLSRVADLALELAEATQAKAMAALNASPEAEPQSRPAADFIHAFDRATRAVRLCSMLESRFEADLAIRAEVSADAARARARAQKEAEANRRVAERTPREIRKDDLRSAVGALIEAETRWETQDERTFHLRFAALDEKLDREWDDFRFLKRPLGAAVKDLCDALGMDDPDWKELENEDWAIAETLAKAPGSPFAHWPTPWNEPEPNSGPTPTAHAHGPGP